MIVVPFIIPVFLPLGFGFFWVRGRYLATSREVKRWEATSRSPVFASFSAILKASGKRLGGKRLGGKSIVLGWFVVGRQGMGAGELQCVFVWWLGWWVPGCGGQEGEGWL